MNPEEPLTTVHESDRDELIAYLDGELPAEDRVRIERRLADEPPYRDLLRQLQQSWDMLDLLPRASATPMFTKTTMEMVAVSAEKDLQQLQARQVRRRRLSRFLGGVGVVAAAALGYVLIRWSLPDPTATLVRDLPILQHLDSYRHAESVDFLRRLRQEGLFVEEVADEG